MKTTDQPENSPANELGLISNEKLCELLQISRRTSYEWRMAGKIPFVSIGTRIFYWEHEVMRALEQHTYRNQPKKTTK